MKNWKAGILAITLYFTCAQAIPCGWDADTIAMEMQAFPTLLELMTGKFLRHSQAFYYWRMKDREEKLQTMPDSLHFYNDLGVAYDKLGMQEKAIAIMLQKEERAPGLYETYANLGTFYIHNKQYEEGLKHIKKAIEINPDAHFGREVYQQYVVEYLLERQQNDSLQLPLGTTSDNFYHYLKDRHIRTAVNNGSSEEAELHKAVKGIAGMMRFGNYDSPILLETLADLLSNTPTGFQAAGNLASRAYLKAAYQVPDGSMRKAYHQKAKNAREQSYSPHNMEEGGSAMRMERLEEALKMEIVAGETWFENIRKDEIGWIESGINPEQAFAKKYYQEPTAKGHDDVDVKVHLRRNQPTQWLESQYTHPEHYMNLHAHVTMTDAEKAFLDNVYKEHFAAEAVADTAAVTGSTTASTLSEDDTSYSGNAVLIFAGIVVVIGGLLVFRDYRKSKAYSQEE